MTTIDEFYKVGPGPVELAYDRPDAYHVRFLSKGGETARGSARYRPLR